MYINRSNLRKVLKSISILSLARLSSCHTLLRGTLPRSNGLPAGNELTGTSWVATEITYPNSQGPTTVLDGNPVTLTFSHNGVSGNAGCNQFSGELISMTPHKFRVGDTMSSDMYCDGDGIMSQEQAFMNVIGQPVIHYNIISDGGEKRELTLWQTVVGEDGVESREGLVNLIPLVKNASSDDIDVLIDQEYENSSLVGNTWLAVEIEGSSPLNSLGPITLSFDSENRVEGFTGCNGFFGEWEELPGSTPSMISTGPLTRTTMGCYDDLMIQEDAVFGALEQERIAYSVTSDGKHLTLYATAVGDESESQAPHSLLHVGRPLIKFIARPDLISVSFGDTSLVGTEWEASEIMGSEAIVFDSPLSLSFESESRLRGYDGCNRFFGNIDLDDDSHSVFRIGRLGSTRRGCSHAVMKQASIFRGVLRHDAVIYNIFTASSWPGNEVTIELTLYKAVIGDDGQMVKGDLLARFNRVPSV
ncbi:hypothetical protein ACHAWF_015039 [Thalassiosira exigua]